MVINFAYKIVFIKLKKYASIVYMEYCDPNKTKFNVVLKAGIQIWYTDEKKENNKIYGIEKISKKVGKKIEDIINRNMKHKGFEIIKSSLEYGDLKLLKFKYDQKTGTILLEVEPSIKHDKRRKMYGYSKSWSQLIENLIGNYGNQAGDNWLEGDASIYRDSEFILELHLDLIEMNIRVPTHFD